MHKLGKTPARKGAVTFKFADYADKTKLPTPPATFGHESLIAATGWGMLGNDQYGDCVWAGAAHETMLWNRMAGASSSFTPAAVLSDYSAVTGFNADDPSTDQGTDMEVAAKYRRKTGVVDAAGKRHQIGAYVALKRGDITELFQAAYLFGAVGIGIEVPSSAVSQFDAGKPWSVVSLSRIEGGHYVPFVARRKYLEVVTWGRIQSMTEGFYEHYNDESIAYLSAEMLAGGKSPEGFDLAALKADLAAL